MQLYNLNAGALPGIIFFSGGLLLVSLSIWLIYIYGKVKTWTRIQGEVVELYLKHTRNIGQFPYGSSFYKDTTYYKPYIKYKYKYFGKEITNTKISYSVHWTQSLTEASELLRGLRHGGPVTVYVDPDKPEKSVLLINDRMPVNLALLGGVIFIIVGVYEIQWAMTSF